MYQHIIDGALPTWTSAKIYCGFLAVQALLSVICPGPIVKGLPIPSENGKQLAYKCSGVTAWYTSYLRITLKPSLRLCRLVMIVSHV
jgi:hypothetical protein